MNRKILLISHFRQSEGWHFYGFSNLSLSKYILSAPFTQQINATVRLIKSAAFVKTDLKKSLEREREKINLKMSKQIDGFISFVVFPPPEKYPKSNHRIGCVLP